ncbi:hypothetical protein L2E82_12290 [Cichorium intybus]|uniref:Uncharacterized protein n=1 Tax=Cichorium intybus TaxID=13427 RepID=A0ACB9GFN8_CICIN|nr:hypothetical protein L2E82_12290 [Cichorium intybus]
MDSSCFECNNINFLQYSRGIKSLFLGGVILDSMAHMGQQKDCKNNLEVGPEKGIGKKLVLNDSDLLIIVDALCVLLGNVCDVHMISNLYKVCMKEGFPYMEIYYFVYLVLQEGGISEQDDVRCENEDEDTLLNVKTKYPPSPNLGGPREDGGNVNKEHLKTGDVKDGELDGNLVTE